jgi:hypothetical protein
MFRPHRLGGGFMRIANVDGRLKLLVAGGDRNDTRCAARPGQRTCRAGVTDTGLDIGTTAALIVTVSAPGQMPERHHAGDRRASAAK